MIRPCKHSTVVAGVLVLTAWVISQGNAKAWGPGGHRVVANIAYDKLSDSERAKILKVIRKIENFQEKFADLMPDDIRNGAAADRDRWTFLQAATWPDLVRPYPPYHHASWHYVNLPFFLSDADEAALKDSIKPNNSAKVPTGMMDDAWKSMNCMQAFKTSLQVLSDTHATDQEKAISYCWLLHLAGDTHQPLHSTSLISRARFNTSEGDRGGNDIPIKRIGNSKELHAYWDGLLGGKQEMQEIQERAKEIMASEEMKAAAAKASANLKVEDWVQESHILAKDIVYSKAILKAVADAEGSMSKIAPVALTPEYQTKAQEIANRRVAEAGYRLAEVLKSID